MEQFFSDYGDWRITAGRRATSYTVSFYDGLRWKSCVRFRSGSQSAFSRCLGVGAPDELAEEAGSLPPL